MIMTFEEFKKRVDENRFIVKQVSGTRFEVYSIETDGKQFYLRQHLNPKTKDGRFRATGYGYSKPIHVMETFAAQLGKEHYEYYSRMQSHIVI